MDPQYGLPASGVAHGAQRRCLILNVEDNEGLRYARTKSLGKAGFTVVEAKSAEEALDLLETEQPDVALVDVRLPGIDGVELCRRIKSGPAKRTIVVNISAAFRDDDSTARALDAGADLYLIEPVNPRKLEASIRALVRMRDAEREVVQLRSELHERGEELAAVLDGMSDGFLLLDSSLNVKSVNRAALQMIGLARDQVTGRPVLDLLGANQEPFLRNCREALASARNVRFDERLGSGDRWYEVDANPHEAGLAVFFRDITERLATSEALRDTLAAAENATHARDLLFAMVSHELRTPLTSILGWAQTLRHFGDPEQMQLGLESIERAATAQARLVDDLVDFARLSSGKVRLTRQPVELDTIVSSALQNFMPQAAERGITLSANTSPVMVLGDASRLQQVVWNLVGNAMKFTGSGGTVNISVETDGSAVSLVVRDSGIGIAPEFLPLVFDLFSQSEPSARRKKGLGLGLAIVKRIIEEHGGQVAAESDGVGFGARFIVTLPLAAAEAQGGPGSSTLTGGAEGERRE